MRDLSELIERLEKLTGPDRDADFAIAAAVFNAKTERNYYAWQSRRPQGTPPRPVESYWKSRGGMACPPFTGSLDAAIALQKRVLPGWEWQAGDDAILGRYAAVYRSSSVGAAGFGEEDIVNAATPAIALVLATLKALQSQGGVDG